MCVSKRSADLSVEDQATFSSVFLLNLAALCWEEVGISPKPEEQQKCSG